MCKIVAFFGEAGSGKDTLTNSLVKNYDFKRFAFSDELKRILSITYSIPIRYFNDRKLKDDSFPIPIFHNEMHHKALENFFCDHSNNPFVEFSEYKFSSPREMMQLVGTEIFRAADPLYWCKVIEAQIRDEERVVISDGRFEDERNWINLYNSQLILIKRNSKNGTKHKSENDFGNDDEYDTIIHNDGSLIGFVNNFDLWYFFIGRKK